MQTLAGFIILVLFQFAGEWIKTQWQLVLPGPIIGMLMLFICLLIFQGIPKPLLLAAPLLIRYLAIMFLPAAAGIFFLGDAIKSQWFAIIAAIVIGTLLSLVFNGIVMKRLYKGKSE